VRGCFVTRPGPQAPRTGSLFDDPSFADHIAFLTRMRDAGFLVAAGPLMDQPGDGMTIVRLPGRDQMEHTTRPATEDDVSVASGFFTVAVRPWHVMLQAYARVSLWRGLDHQHLVQSGDLEQPARHRCQVSDGEAAAGRPYPLME
jgi:uncharacterized protein YciI